MLMQASALRFLVSTAFSCAALFGSLVASARDSESSPSSIPEAKAAPARGWPARVSAIAVYGDAPYGTTPTDTEQFDATPAFIESINADPDVDRVIHVGDIHSGKQYCTEAYDRSLFELWSHFEVPLVYTPGDNEWVDCHKPAEGGGTFNAVTGQVDHVLDTEGAPLDYAGGDPV